MPHGDTRVLSIFGSPRERGFSSIMHGKLLEVLRQHDIGVKEFHVYEKEIRPCTACGNCSREFRCIHDDDLSPLYPLLRDIPLVSISSPVYFSGPSGPLKNFIDRCQVLWELVRREPGSVCKKQGVFFSAAGRDYTGVFTPSGITMRHLFKTLNADVVENEFFLLAGTDLRDSVPGEMYDRIIKRAESIAMDLRRPGI